jgi:mannosyltransferase OCH1-like enzyme
MTIKKIHQIWIADDNAEPSDFIKNQMFKVKQKYNDYEYKLWSNNDIIDFISKHFDKDVLNAYNKVKAYAFKADLARYCILYIKGGFYIDSALKPLTKIDFIEPLVIARGIPGELTTNNKPILENNLIICNQINHNFLNLTIKKCVININNEYYHKHPLEVTGPMLLASINDNTDITFLHVKEYRNIKTTYVNDQPFMKHKHHRTQASLLKMNCIGTNNYEKMWFEKKIY